ncbi:MAG: sterol carrier protein domain-containing protein, partial [Anaerolineaceae bacterium]|nr:sterol carrier protein domain-containing protein [Anaerolineaceae bacterium]
ISISTLAPLLKQELAGSVERMPVADGIQAYRSYLEEMRTRVHGMALMDANLDERIKDSKSWMLVVKEKGQETGFMLYRIEEEKRWQKSINAEHFYYTTPLARMKMLEWIARHTDQVERTEIHLPPWEHPELWMVDIKSKMEVSLAHAPMGRVIDLAMLNGIQSGSGSFSAQIMDPFCPWNEGAWRFDSANGVLQVERVASADSRLSIQGLSAWLIGSNDPGDFDLRGWGQIQPGTAGSMRSMLPLAPAYMYETY